MDLFIALSYRTQLTGTCATVTHPDCIHSHSFIRVIMYDASAAPVAAHTIAQSYK
eukprot:COSAG02_NODE_3418_length_6778_cov_36.646654_4_plen_55_part_00